jgi:hypothetical protein
LSTINAGCNRSLQNSMVLFPGMLQSFYASSSTLSFSGIPECALILFIESLTPFPFSNTLTLEIRGFCCPGRHPFMIELIAFCESVKALNLLSKLQSWDANNIEVTSASVLDELGVSNE